MRVETPLPTFTNHNLYMDYSKNNILTTDTRLLVRIQNNRATDCFKLLCDTSIHSEHSFGDKLANKNPNNENKIVLQKQSHSVTPKKYISPEKVKNAKHSISPKKSRMTSERRKNNFHRDQEEIVTQQTKKLGQPIFKGGMSFPKNNFREDDHSFNSQSIILSEENSIILDVSEHSEDRQLHYETKKENHIIINRSEIEDSTEKISDSCQSFEDLYDKNHQKEEIIHVKSKKHIEAKGKSKNKNNAKIKTYKAPTQTRKYDVKPDKNKIILVSQAAIDKTKKRAKNKSPPKNSRSTISLFTESKNSNKQYIETLKKNLKVKNKKTHKNQPISESESSISIITSSSYSVAANNHNHQAKGKHQAKKNDYKHKRGDSKKKNRNFESLFNNKGGNNFMPFPVGFNPYMQFLAPYMGQGSMQMTPQPFNMMPGAQNYPMNYPQQQSQLFSPQPTMPFNLSSINAYPSYQQQTPMQMPMNQNYPQQPQQYNNQMGVSPFSPDMKGCFSPNSNFNFSSNNILPNIDNAKGKDSNSCNMCEEIYKYTILNNLPLKIMTCLYCNKTMNSTSLEFYLKKYKEELEGQYRKNILSSDKTIPRVNENDYSICSSENHEIKSNTELTYNSNTVTMQTLPDYKIENKKYAQVIDNEDSDIITPLRKNESNFTQNEKDVPKKNESLNLMVLDTTDTGMSLAEIFKQKRAKLLTRIDNRTHSAKEKDPKNRSLDSSMGGDNMEMKNISKIKKKRELSVAPKINVDLIHITDENKNRINLSNLSKYNNSILKTEPSPELLERLIHGKKATLSQKEIREVNKRLYEKLCEVKYKIKEDHKKDELAKRNEQRKQYTEKLKNDVVNSKRVKA